MLTRILEAILMVAGEPLSLERLERLFEESEKPDRAALRAAVSELQKESEHRSIELVEVAGGYRFQTKKNYAEWVGRLFTEKPLRYSRAFLETLALIAYKQPITRAEIEAVRGVGVNSTILKTLLEREWIRVVGYREVPGRPTLYGTTKSFLDHFGLKELSELPSLESPKAVDRLGLPTAEVVTDSQAGPETSSHEQAHLHPYSQSLPVPDAG